MGKPLPLIIQRAPERLEAVMSTRILRYADGRIRGMRSERRAAVADVLRCLLHACCLQFQGGTVAVSNGVARPLTIADIAARAGLGIRRVSRCLRDLRMSGLVRIGEKQIIRRNGAGVILVSPCLRMFTELFWRLIGLWRDFVDGVRHAVQHGTLRFRLPWTQIGPSGKAVPRAAPKTEEEGIRYLRAQGRIIQCPSWQLCQRACASPTCDPYTRRVCRELSPS